MEEYRNIKNQYVLAGDHQITLVYSLFLVSLSGSFTTYSAYAHLAQIVKVVSSQINEILNNLITQVLFFCFV